MTAPVAAQERRRQEDDYGAGEAVAFLEHAQSSSGPMTVEFCGEIDDA